MESLIINHLSGPRRARPDVFALDDQLIVTFGSDSACDVSFDDEGAPEVCPTHARIERDSMVDGKFWLHDLSGGHGLLVNDAFVGGKVSIRPGDLVRLGREGPAFEVQLGDAPPPPPAATDAATVVKHSVPAAVLRNTRIPWIVGLAVFALAAGIVYLNVPKRTIIEAESGTQAPPPIAAPAPIPDPAPTIVSGQAPTTETPQTQPESVATEPAPAAQPVGDSAASIELAKPEVENVPEAPTVALPKTSEAGPAAVEKPKKAKPKVSYSLAEPDPVHSTPVTAPVAQRDASHQELGPAPRESWIIIKDM